MNYSSLSASSTSTSSSGSGGSTSGGPTGGSLTARGPSHTSRHTASQTSKTALQSLVRTKCWSIAPLWKFVTYELEQGPTRTNFTRSASVRSGGGHQRKVKISYENDMLQTTVPKRRWSKPHPQQSFSAASVASKPTSTVTSSRQPLKQTNHRPLEAVVEEKPIAVEQPPVVEEWKPCGVLKKPGSYRGHASLKKVAFLENTELNRSTL